MVHTSRQLLGVCLVVGSVLWALSWGVIALLADTYGSDLQAWVIVGAALSVGVLGVVLGINVARHRNMSRRTWLAWSIVILVPFALPLLHDDHGASGVNPMVERAYVRRGHVRAASADCSYAERNDDGSEWWVCDVETRGPYDSDLCNIDVSRSTTGSRIVRIQSCLNDDI
ncbi:MAG: hypothetical protein M3P18_15580 [Actinomycetota bacterium]|nr:hypothetical protein [Actinomycetota bacterium]